MSRTGLAEQNGAEPDSATLFYFGNDFANFRIAFSMTLRVEYPGAIYYLMNRSHRGGTVYYRDVGRQDFRVRCQESRRFLRAGSKQGLTPAWSNSRGV